MQPKSDQSSTGLRHSLLLVDDDTELCALMVTFFFQNGFLVESVYDGRRVLARALEGRFDLILLDVMLPGLDGFEVLHQLRRRSAVPVIMLTTRTEQADRIAGLNTGADDYLPKPFGPEELLARIRAVLRRTSQPGRLLPEALEVFVPYYLLVLLAVALLCYVLAVNLATPLRVLGKAVEEFGKGNLSIRVNSRRRDEIGGLSRAFDQMADRIQTLLTAERRLLAAGHLSRAAVATGAAELRHRTR